MQNIYEDRERLHVHRYHFPVSYFSSLLMTIKSKQYSVGLQGLTSPVRLQEELVHFSPKLFTHCPNTCHSLNACQR